MSVLLAVWWLLTHPAVGVGDPGSLCAAPIVAVAADFDDARPATLATVSLCWPWNALATDDDAAALLVRAGALR